jgi:adenylosuccinate lyase
VRQGGRRSPGEKTLESLAGRWYWILTLSTQVLHEAIREHSMAAGRRVKEEGASNDLLQRIASDPLFAAVHATLDQLLDPTKFVGRAPEQVTEFLLEYIDPLVDKYASQLRNTAIDAVNV